VRKKEAEGKEKDPENPKISETRGGRRVGVMGGGFNPIHFGHLRAAEEMAEGFGLDPVVFVPTAIPPHKGGLSMAPFPHRFEMVKLSIEGRPGFVASDLEARLPGPSYTVNTLKALGRELEPGSELFFLIGFDSFGKVGSWHKFPELFELASFVVNVRPAGPGTASGPPANPGSKELLLELLAGFFGETPAWDGKKSACLIPGLRPVYYFEGTGLAISSTDIRSRLARGASARYLVPEATLDHLVRHGVYADSPTTRKPAR
jgi:nicotinate-nucleotide adenylyltransferase